MLENAAFNFRAFLISPALHKGMLTVFKEARALVIANKFEEGRRIRLSVLGEAFEVFQNGAEAERCE
jgi:hypothetical protein